MIDTTSENDTPEPPEPKAGDLLSFRSVGRVLDRNFKAISAEFSLMRGALKRHPSPAELGDIARKCGTHLLKLNTARASTDQSVMRFETPPGAPDAKLVPSVNAAVIPFAKLVLRPLDIRDAVPRHLVDHILRPDDISAMVCEAFVAVFSKEHLAELRKALAEDLPPITSLPAAEFPIIFLPRPGGGDVQITPLAPAAAFMAMKDVAAPYRAKQEKGAPKVIRGKWTDQSVSSKPQNISGAIGGPRRRFRADFPAVLDRWDAEIHRYAHGGAFPRLRDPEIAEAILAYADRLRQSEEYSNADIREGLDKRADRLIAEARAFVSETLDEVRARFPDHDRTLSEPPDTAAVLLRRAWPTGRRDEARWALTSPHFDYRTKQTGG